MNPFFTGIFLGGIAGFIVGKLPWWFLFVAIAGIAMATTYQFGMDLLEDQIGSIFDNDQ